MDWFGSVLSQLPAPNSWKGDEETGVGIEIWQLDYILTNLIYFVLLYIKYQGNVSFVCGEKLSIYKFS